MIDALIGAGAELLGGISSGLFGQSSANKQMRWQERMSNTAHQREVADLRAAGLNPILSASRGGASTPTGASATMPNPAAGMANTFSARNLLAQQQQRMDKIEGPVAAAHALKLRNEADLAAAQAETERIRPAALMTTMNLQDQERALAAARTLVTNLEQYKTTAQTELIKAQVPWEQAKAEIANGFIRAVEMLRGKLPGLSPKADLTGVVKDTLKEAYSTGNIVNPLDWPAQLRAVLTDHLKNAAAWLQQTYSNSRGVAAPDLSAKELR